MALTEQRPVLFGPRFFYLAAESPDGQLTLKSEYTQPDPGVHSSNWVLTTRMAPPVALDRGWGTDTGKPETAIPEPGTAALMALSLIVLILFARRRDRC